MRGSADMSGAGEDQKQCPRCRASVLAAARVCKNCRHRFDPEAAPLAPSSSGSSRPSQESPGPVAGRRLRPLALLAGLVLAAAIVIGLVISGSDSMDESSVADEQPEIVISGDKIEERLDGQLASQTNDDVEDVSCPARDLTSGEKLDCDVHYESGAERMIVVQVSGSADDPELEVELK